MKVLLVGLMSVARLGDASQMREFLTPRWKESKPIRMNSTALHNGTSHGAASVIRMDPEAKRRFDEIYSNREWALRDGESLSGEGSKVSTTTTLRNWLGQMLHKYQVKVFLDLPCGDANWQGLIPGLDKVEYYGFDIAQQAIETARIKNKHRPSMHFDLFDLGSAAPMKADMHLIKDVVQHWPLGFAMNALRNAKAAGTRYLMATTFPATTVNQNIPMGGFYKANLAISPFFLPPAIERQDPQFDYPFHDFGAVMEIYDLQSWTGGAP